MAKYASKVVSRMQDWLGKNEYDGSHKSIIDTYNSQKILPRNYRVKYTDAWCATTVCAAFISLGYQSLIPMECSCGYMVEKAVAMGIWEEKDNYTPSPGDIIYYDWQDSSVGDNKGWPDHVGIVEYVQGGKFVVIEGNYRGGVNRRQMSVDGQYIRGFICPRYDIEEEPKSGEKTIEEVAREVIRGKWGNGSERKRRLKDAGYDYNVVQAKVNEILR